MFLINSILTGAGLEPLGLALRVLTGCQNKENSAGTSQRNDSYARQQNASLENSRARRSIESELELTRRRGLSADNPILEHLEIESKLVPEEDAAKARETVEKIADETRTRLMRKELTQQMSGKPRLTPQEELKTVYEVMHDMGFRYKEMDRLIPGLLSSRLDCDTSSRVVLAVAHEMKWPVYGVYAPKHFFVRWDDGQGTKFNMDFGESHGDEYYQKWLSISEESIRKGVYLANLSTGQLRSHSLNLLCNEKSDTEDNVDALAACDKAVEMDPSNIFAYSARSMVESRLSMGQLSEEDQKKILELDPNNFSVLMNSGIEFLSQKKYYEAYDMFKRANKADLNNPEPFYFAGQIQLQKGHYEAAIADFDAAHDLLHEKIENRSLSVSDGRLMPRDAAELNVDAQTMKQAAMICLARGVAKAKLERYEEAMQDYGSVVRSQADDEEKATAYGNWGVATFLLAKKMRDEGKIGLSKYYAENAIEYYKKAAALDPALEKFTLQNTGQAESFLKTLATR